MDATTSAAPIDRKSLTEAALGLAATAIDASEKVLRVKQTVDHAIGDGVHAARRAVRKSRYAAEDLADQASLQVRQHPFESVLVAFAAGVFFGGTLLYAISRISQDVPAPARPHVDPDAS